MNKASSLLKMTFRGIFILLGFLSLTGTAATEPEPGWFRRWSDQSTEFVRKAAESGNGQAQCFLAWRYYQGTKGLPQNHAEALKWFARAAEGGVTEAQLKLGVCYESGLGLPQDYPEALKWYRRAAGSGNAQAQYKLGQFYSGATPIISFKKQLSETSYTIVTQPIIPRDDKQSAEWFDKAAAQGYGPALIHKSVPGPREMPEAQRAETLSKNYLLAARQGVAEAEYLMGTRCFEGRGVPVDLVESEMWNQLAFAQGLTNALPVSQRQASYIAEKERDVVEHMRLSNPKAEPNINVIRSLIILPASISNRVTEAQIAEATRKAKEFKPDPSSLRWRPGDVLLHFRNPSPGLAGAEDSGEKFNRLKAAAERGDANAQFNLALCLQHDSYLPAQIQPPRPYFRAEHGMLKMVTPSQNDGEELRSARETQAFQWYSKAAQQGHLDARYYAAWMSYNGCGTGKDTDTALQSLKKLAAQGYAEAQYYIGKAYHDGSLGQTNLAEAAHWYHLAADQGISAARTELLALGIAVTNPPVAAPATVSAAPAPETTRRPLRLALVAEDDRSQAAVDLLTTEFTQYPSVELLERNQINRILTEQAQSLGGRRDWLSIGKLLRADGLLTVGSHDRTNGTIMVTQLIAVGPGGMADILEQVVPQKGLIGWAAITSKKYAALLPKLGVPAESIIPISLLNLRSALATEDSTSLDRELNFLLARRLVSEPNVFVLDRWHMDRLREEKLLTAGEDTNFWKGSFLLDGVVNRDGLQSGRVTLHVRLAPADGSTPVTLELADSHDHLVALVDQLVTRLLVALKSRTKAHSWDPREEALNYFEEARWASHWGMNQEAVAAAESSWTLGFHSGECLGLRITPLLAQAGLPTVKIIDISSPSFDPSTYTQPVPPLLEPAKFGLAQRANGIFLDAKDDPKKLNDGNSYQTAIAMACLTTSSALLSYLQQPSQAKDWNDPSLPLLRAQLRQISQWLEQVSDAVLSKQKKALEEEEVWRGSLWQDTTEEMLAHQHRMIKDGWHYRVWKQNLYEEFAQKHYLVSWPPSPKSDLVAPWIGLLKDEWTNNLPVARLTAGLLLLESADNDYDRSEWSEKTLALLQEQPLTPDDNYAALFFAKRLDRIVRSFRSDSKSEGVFRKRFNEHLEPAVSAYLKTLEDKLKEGERLAEEKQAKEEQAKEQETKNRWAQERAQEEKERREKYQHLLEDLTAFLTNATKPNDFGLIRHFGNFRLTPEDAGRLMPLRDSYAKRVTNNISMFVVDHFFPAVPKTAPVTPPPAHTPAPAAEAPKPEAVLKKALTVDRVLNFANPGQFSYDDFTPRSKRPVQYLEGKLWFQLNGYSGIGHSPESYRHVIVCLDPVSLQLEEIAIPNIAAAKTGYAYDGRLTWSGSDNNALPVFTVHKGYVYLVLPDGLNRYSQKEHRWDKVQVTIPPSADLYSLGDKLLASSDEGIFEINPDAHTTELLASTRRRPAQNHLDELDHLKSAPLFSGPNGELRALIDQNIYACRPDTKSWDKTGSIPVGGWQQSWQRDGLLLFSRGFNADYLQLAALSFQHESGESWLIITNRNYNAFMPPQFRRGPGLPASRWQIATSINFNRPADEYIAAGMERDTLYLLPQKPSLTYSQETGLVASSSGETGIVTLQIFEVTNNSPKNVCLRLGQTTLPGKLHDQVLQNGLNPATAWHLFLTPDQVVFINSGLQTAWFLPRTQLEEYLKVSSN